MQHSVSSVSGENVGDVKHYAVLYVFVKMNFSALQYSLHHILPMDGTVLQDHTCIGVFSWIPKYSASCISYIKGWRREYLSWLSGVISYWRATSQPPLSSDCVTFSVSLGTNAAAYRRLSHTAGKQLNNFVHIYVVLHSVFPTAKEYHAD
jgi:hypothetical protein